MCLPCNGQLKHAVPDTSHKAKRDAVCEATGAGGGGGETGACMVYILCHTQQCDAGFSRLVAAKGTA